MALRAFAAIFILAIGSCTSPNLGLSMRRSGAETARSCAARGLSLDHLGMFGAPTCVTRYADAGKACRSKADCLGDCIVQLGTPETNGMDFAVGFETGGMCASQDFLEGCFATLDNGKVIRSVCSD